tara:strand:- start:245 stop:421 length:177 start_codon:yes stop_codon:yes gene_type:complete
MRDINSILAYAKQMKRKAKEHTLNKLMRKEVHTGANGTQKYMLKQGVNAGKVVGNKFQ